METDIKTEQDETLDKVKIEVMELIRAYDSSGLSEAQLSRTMTNTSTELRMNAINSLTNEGKLQLCKRGADLIYRLMDDSLSTNHSVLLTNNISLEERAVFQVIQSAGSKGIWNREIRNQTKLPLNQMSKVLKNLETKKLIKAVKSVTASKKKLYMLYGIEPDRSVTGGAWYSGTEFESEYVQILHEQCYQFVKRRLTSSVSSMDFSDARQATLVSSTEVKDYIDNLKISNEKLSLQDIEMVLETIVFDGLIEKISVTKEQPESLMTINTESTRLSSDEEQDPKTQTIYFYRALNKLVDTSGVMRTPCGQCPHFHECRPGAVISPEKCQYYERW